MPVEDYELTVSWRGDLEANRELFAGVQRANKALEEEVGRSAAFVTADWNTVRDSEGRTLLELTLTDRFTRSQAIEKFDPDELRGEEGLVSRIHRMWGRLLQDRSDRQIKRLEELAIGEEGD